MSGTPHLHRRAATAGGFTLVEMALVLLIVGLLAAVFLPATNTLLDNNRRKETRAKLEALEQAMVRFVMVNQRLPCPADGALPPGNVNQGRELGGGGGACNPLTQINGVVPWRSLGLAQGDATDAWHTLVTYRVWPALTLTGGMDMPWNPATQNAQIQTFLQAQGLKVCSTSPCPGTAVLADRLTMTGAAYVLISHGANRVHGFTTDGLFLNTANGTGPGPSEDVNRNRLAIYTTAPSDFYVDAELAENPMAYYDDIVLWPTVMAVAMAAGVGPRKP